MPPEEAIDIGQDPNAGGPKPDAAPGKQDGADKGGAEKGQDPTRLAAELASLRDSEKSLREKVALAEKKRDDAVQTTLRLVQALEEEARTEASPKDGTPEPSLKDLFEEDPEKALEVYHAKRLGPLIRRNVMTQASIIREMERDRLKADKMLSKVLEKQEPEVDKFLGNMHEDVQASPGSYTNALAFTLAGKFLQPEGRKEIWEWLNTEFGNGAGETPFVEGASAPGPRPDGRKTMSSLEKEVAQGLGISDDDFMVMREEQEKFGKWQDQRS